MISCPHCSRENNDRLVFCLGCGAELHAPDTAAAAQLAATPPSAPAVTAEKRIQLHGVAQGLAYCRAAIVRSSGDGRELPIPLSQHDFDLALGDGEVIHVHVQGETQFLAPPPVTFEAAWSEIESRRELAGARFAPPIPPFESVKLSSSSIGAGQEVRVHGVPEHGFVEGSGGPRAAPQPKLSSIRARIVAAGPDAPLRMAAAIARLEPRTDQPEDLPEHGPGKFLRDGWWPGSPICFALAAGFAVVLGGGLALAARVQVILYVAVMLAPAIFWLPVRPRLRLPVFRVGVEPYLRDRSLSFLAAIFILATWPQMPIYVPLHGWGANLGVAIGCAASVLLLLIADWVGERRSFALVSELLRARARSPLSPGSWGAWEGTVACGAPVKVGTVDAVIVREAQYSAGEKLDERTEQRLLSTDTFEVITEQGTILVDVKQTVWASAAFLFSRGHGHPYTVNELIPVGGRIALAGKLEGDPRGGLTLRAMGTRPALLYASTGRGDPVRFLRAVVWRRRLMRLALVAILAVIVGAWIVL